MKIKELLYEARYDDLVSDLLTHVEKKFKDHAEYSDIESKFAQYRFLWRITRNSNDFKKLQNSWKMYLATALRNEAFKFLGKYHDESYNSKLKNKNDLQLDFNDISSVINHFSDVPYHKIQNFNPLESVTPLKDLRALDDEFKETTGENLVDLKDGDEIILDFGQYKWILLNRGSCEDEAKATGHCGNAGAIPGDRIISFRKTVEIDGETRYKPYLTFILNHGTLGEMKSSGNDKPAEKYHQYIVELLKLPIIKKIKGGGYLPENNFKISDLNDSYLDTLRKARGSDYIDLQLIIEDPLNIENIKEPSEKLQMVAVREYNQAIELIKNPTDKVKRLQQELWG